MITTSKEKDIRAKPTKDAAMPKREKDEGGQFSGRGAKDFDIRNKSSDQDKPTGKHRKAPNVPDADNADKGEIAEDIDNRISEAKPGISYDKPSPAPREPPDKNSSKNRQRKRAAAIRKSETKEAERIEAEAENPPDNTPADTGHGELGDIEQQSCQDTATDSTYNNPLKPEAKDFKYRADRKVLRNPTKKQSARSGECTDGFKGKPEPDSPRYGNADSKHERLKYSDDKTSPKSDRKHKKQQHRAYNESDGMKPQYEPEPEFDTHSYGEAESKHQRLQFANDEPVKEPDKRQEKKRRRKPVQQSSREEKQSDTSVKEEAVSDDSVATNIDKLKFSPDELPPENISPRGVKAGKKYDRATQKSEKIDNKLEKARENLPTKKSIRRSMVYDEQKGTAKKKLKIEEEVKSQRQHVKGPLPLRPVKLAANSATAYAHKKLYQVEHENVGVKAGHRAEIAAEGALRSALRFHKTKPYRRVEKLQQKSTKARVKMDYQKAVRDNPKLQSNALSRMMQKKRIKKQYAKAARYAKRNGVTVEEAVAAVATKKAKMASSVMKRHPVAIGSIAVMLLIIIVLFTQFSSCSNIMTGGMGVIFMSSYTADDDDIDNAELYYTELETDLKMYINSLEAENPGYDEYMFSVGEISHNPYELMSFLTAVYGDFSFNRIKPVLDTLFNAQYKLSTESYVEERTVTKTVEVGASIGDVRTTAYCACSICCGQWANGITASGTVATANRTIAVDAYNPIVPMGTKLVINGVQYTVEDTGNLKANGGDIDIFFATHSEAIQWGRQTHTAYLAEGNENTVEVTITEKVNVLEVTLSTRNFTALVNSIMNDEQRDHFRLLMQLRGNRQYLDSPFDFNWIPYISSHYGYRIHPISGEKNYHKGIDIAATYGTEILAGHDGKVTAAAYDDGYGNYIVLDNGKGLVSKYAHCSELLVSRGQKVESGDVIAKVGSTGASTGAHLHLEIIMKGQYLNPIYFAETNDDGSSPGYGDPGAPMGEGTYGDLIAEAEKHLGKPYVFGAAGPNAFDCSSFVCWVFTYSGVYNMPRTTAQGIYNQCTPVSPSDAQPGDIIFFQGTYSTSDTVTHVGIYVGNGQMIHCGSPIQYTSINSPYWQQHFYSFGRIN